MTAVQIKTILETKLKNNSKVILLSVVRTRNVHDDKDGKDHFDCIACFEQGSDRLQQFIHVDVFTLAQIH